MRHNRRIVTAALVPALALGGISLGTAATTVLATAGVAAAAQPGPWSTPTTLGGGATEGKTVVDVATTTDGTAVAVWYRWTGAGFDAELNVAVRPAASTVWGPAKVLGTTQDGAEDVTLTPAWDGSMTVTWVEDQGVNSSLRTTTLARGATAWPAPTTIATRASMGGMAFAHNPTPGKSMAVWQESAGASSVLWMSERTGTGAWSAPKALGGTSAYRPQVAIASNGAVTVTWDEAAETGQTVTSADRPAGSTQWTAPTPISAPDEGGASHLTVGPDGTAALTWVKYTYADDADDTTAAIVTAVRPYGGTWKLDEPLPLGGAEASAVLDPLVGPTGEVTLVWTEDVDPGENNLTGVRTASRTPDGTWTTAKTLSTGYVPEQFDAAIGADGTVQAGWSQNGTGDDDRNFYTTARINGEWTPLVRLSRAGSVYAEGRVAVAPDGDATAVFAQNNQLWAAGTGLTAPTPTPAPAKHRDYVGKDGFPDLYAQTTGGLLYVYQGNANKTVSAKVSGGTWPTTSAVVPFGDLNGDGCNDTLVRTSTGELWRYNPACGTPVTPTAPRVKIGSSGWAAFDALTWSGDFNADRRPDLIARQISTGDLYLYTGTTTGGLTRVGKIGSGWKSLTIVGTGDLNGDKNADLIARTSTGYLYRYLGTGRSTIGSGVKIGSGWGGMVNMVGIGDLTGDGKNDVLGRTTAGDLYRYAGTGTGAIGSGTKIGTGWKSFASIK